MAYDFIINLSSPTSSFGITFDTGSLPPTPPDTGSYSFNGILTLFSGDIIETDSVTDGMIMKDNGDVWLYELMEI